jgi:hypothetical protein
MPAQVVTGQFSFSANFQQTGILGAVPSVTLNQIMNQTLQYVNATGQALGVDQMYGFTGTLVSTTKIFHFQTGVLNDIFGNPLAMLRVRDLLIINLSATASNVLKVYATSSNGITWVPPIANFLSVYGGLASGAGMLRIADPYSFGGSAGNVVGATTDGLEVDSGSNTVSFAIIALGCSVA